MENRFEIQGNSLIIHLPKEVDHMVTDEIRRDSDDIIRKNIYERSHLIFRNSIYGQFRDRADHGEIPDDGDAR